MRWENNGPHIIIVVSLTILTRSIEPIFMTLRNCLSKD